MAHYTREFGFVLPDRKIHVDDLRVRAVAHSAPERAKPVRGLRCIPMPCYVWQRA